MTASISAADWESLQAAIAGRVLLPGAADYESARVPEMARFRGIRPAAVVRCRGAEDVVEALGLARRAGLEVAVRGGGHCFAGGSSTVGMLIDMSLMNRVEVGDTTVNVGAGAQLGLVYDALEPTGRTLMAGCGPTVGIAGLALGGGIGILGRRHGLTSDQLLAAQVVLADGRIVWCDESECEDLFWALRGSGGCRFGVVTDLVVRTVAAPDITCVEVSWPAETAASVIDAWQRWAPGAPEQVAVSVLVTAPADPGAPPRVRAFGAIQGTTADAQHAIGELIHAVGSDPTGSTFEHLPYRQGKRYLAEYDQGSVAKPYPGHLFAKSEFFRTELPSEIIDALVDHLARERIAGEARELDFAPWGGAYNGVGPAATAFAHRAERFLLKHEVAVDARDAGALEQPAREWLRRSWGLAHAVGTGGAYSNFPDPDLDDWDPAYHGENRARLLRIKDRFDPEGVFGVACGGSK